jgi:hypothetical protein
MEERYGKFYYDAKERRFKKKLWDEMLNGFEFATI